MLYRHLTVLQSDFDRDMMSDDDIHEFTAVNVIQGHCIFSQITYINPYCIPMNAISHIP